MRITSTHIRVVLAVLCIATSVSSANARNPPPESISVSGSTATCLAHMAQRVTNPSDPQIAGACQCLAEIWAPAAAETLRLTLNIADRQSRGEAWLAIYEHPTDLPLPLTQARLLLTQAAYGGRQRSSNSTVRSMEEAPLDNMFTRMEDCVTRASLARDIRYFMLGDGDSANEIFPRLRPTRSLVRFPLPANAGAVDVTALLRLNRDGTVERLLRHNGSDEHWAAVEASLRQGVYAVSGPRVGAWDGYVTVRSMTDADEAAPLFPEALPPPTEINVETLPGVQPLEMMSIDPILWRLDSGRIRRVTAVVNVGANGRATDVYVAYTEIWRDGAWQRITSPVTHEALEHGNAAAGVLREATFPTELSDGTRAPFTARIRLRFR